MKLSSGFRDLMGGELGAVQHDIDLNNSVINSWSNKEHNSNGTHGAVTSSSLDNTGQTAFGGPWYVQADTVISPPTMTANANDYRPVGIDTAVVLRLSSDASRDLTGIYNSNTTRFRWLLLINVGNQNIVLKHNVTSTVRFRLACFGSADVTVNSADSVWLFYDSSSANWRVIGV